MDKKSSQRAALSGARAPYTRPKLKELGQVSALTQAGTGDMAEMLDMDGNAMGMMADMESRP